MADAPDAAALLPIHWLPKSKLWYWVKWVHYIQQAHSTHQTSMVELKPPHGSEQDEAEVAEAAQDQVDPHPAGGYSDSKRKRHNVTKCGWCCGKSPAALEVGLFASSQFQPAA
jgi:hypothetical protein